MRGGDGLRCRCDIVDNRPPRRQLPAGPHGTFLRVHPGGQLPDHDHGATLRAADEHHCADSNDDHVLLVGGSQLMSTPRRDDAGFTLIELLVYMFLATIVGTIVAGILINSLRVQVQIQDAAAAAQGSFLIADAVGTAARNSLAMQATTLGDGTLVVVTRSLNPSVASTTTAGPENFLCYGFAVAGGDIRYTTSSSAIAPANAADTATWTQIAAGAQRVASSTPILQVLDSGRALRLALIAEQGDGGPQQVDTTIRSLQGPDRETGLRTGTPCF